MLEEIKIPDSNDPEWQTQMLSIITGLVSEVFEEDMSDAAYDKLQLALTYIEALQEYSGY